MKTRSTGKGNAHIAQLSRPSLDIDRQRNAEDRKKMEKTKKMECNRNRILTPQAIKQMIAEGHAIVIFDNFVLRLDSWLSRHPGGRLAILHMIGKDATDEMTV